MTHYQHIVSNPNGLYVDAIRRACPAIFAPGKAESRSSRYTYIPTNELLAALAGAGFTPTLAMQAGSRTGEEDYTKHLLRFRMQQDLGRTVADAFEIVLVNSHNGTSAYELMLGYFRLVCGNGCIFGEFETIKVRHQGDIVRGVVDGTLELAEQRNAALARIEEYKQTGLPQNERLLLAEHVHRARFGEDSNTLITPEDLLRPRRRADMGDDLYSTVNVVQENVIQGGQSRRDRQGKRHTTRGINGIAQNVQLNRLIGGFAEELRKLHA